MLAVLLHTEGYGNEVVTIVCSLNDLPIHFITLEGLLSQSMQADIAFFCAEVFFCPENVHIPSQGNGQPMIISRFTTLVNSTADTSLSLFPDFHAIFCQNKVNKLCT